MLYESLQKMQCSKPLVKNHNSPAIEPVPTWSAQRVPQTGSEQEDEYKGNNMRAVIRLSYNLTHNRGPRTSRGHPRSVAVMLSTWS